MSAANGSARVSRVVPADPGLVFHDLDLERQILAACLVGPHLLLGCDLVDHDFYSGANQILWRAMLHLHADGEPIDPIRLRSHLADNNQLGAVGGFDYLLELDGAGIAAAPLPTKRLKRLSAERRMRAAAQQLAASVDEPIHQQRFLREFDRARTELEQIDGMSLVTHRLDGLWKTVGELGMLDARPEPQEWVLMRPDTETNGMANPIGLLPRSEVGFVLGAGGLGKSFLTMQLALSVATGRKWLDHFLVPNPGRVLMLLGEEKLKQAHRRLYELGHAMRLTDPQMQLARERIVLMPLSGVIAPFVHQDGGSTAETDVMPWLRARMQGAEWTLVLIDPASRFAGADTEKDNVQATRFIQVVESLCAMPGAPTVLLVHHSNKTSRAEDAAKPSASDARGASALTDGGRWCANLARRPGGVALHITKNNYAEEHDQPVRLERVFGGYLRVETIEAKAREEDAKERTRQAKEHELRDRILKLLSKRPGLSKSDVRDVLQADRTAVFRVMPEMVGDGLLVEAPKNAFRIAPNQGGFDA